VTEEITVYDAVGGERFFFDLVDRFYAGVESDPILGPMYPSDDLAGARERLATFLVQFWGGPTTYSENRGHPRLRMRHFPFRVDSEARDAWLRHMMAALEESEGPEVAIEMITDYFVRSAEFMRNVEEAETPPSECL